MPKEKSHHGDWLIQASNTPDNIPQSVIERLEQEIRGIDHGGVSLVVNIRDRHLTFRIEKTVSIVPDKK
ncbi:MAG: hypothetical protein LBH20_06915 [Treponema sp.]|jgi:hypothetical protein|nr:hypothetical protein [Treponema sp.]